MANLIKLKRSAVAGKAPTTSDLELGELALNTYDGKLYTKKDNGSASIVELSGGGGGGGPIAETQYVINQDVVLATGSHALSLYSAEIGAGYSVTVPVGTIWTLAVL